MVKVAVIEDRREIRDGLAALVNGSQGFCCTGAFRSMEDALPALGASLPDIVLVDIGLPGMSGIDGIRLLKERHPVLQFLILTVYDDDERIFEALCAGACGYLLKRTAAPRLLESLKEVSEGGAPMSPEVARRVIQMFREPPKQADHQLTPHQARLLKLLADGHNYKTAAAELGVTVDTIGYHLRHIYEKLQVHSKSEAVAKALRDRIIS
jgi:DNA-binding NarL/FixJ family response regulator